MAKTIQPHSWKASLSEPDKNYHIEKLNKEESMNLYLSLIDDLNDLYKNLCKLNDLTEKRNLEEQIKSQQPRQTP